VTQYALTWCINTLLLTAVAIMASVLAAGPAQGLGGRVTRFVCAKCTETGQLSSWGLFLSRAAVWRHLGFQEIQVDVLTSDVMAGGGGAAGPAQDVIQEGTKRH
jgi:hypothetical protein